MGPYRVAAEVEPEPAPIACLRGHRRGPGQCSGCKHVPPHPARFFATIGPPAPPPGSQAGTWARVATLAALGVLSGATAALAAVTWNVAHSRTPTAAVVTLSPQAPVAAVVAASPPLLVPAPPAAPRSAAPDRSPPPLPEVALPVPAPLSPPSAESHSIEELWRRAEWRQKTGADLTLIRATLPRAPWGSLLAAAISARIDPERRGGAAVGIRVGDVGPRARPVSGLEEGDLITAVNGFPMTTPEAALAAYQHATQTEGLLLEIVRRERRVVLRVELAGPTG